MAIHSLISSSEREKSEEVVSDAPLSEDDALLRNKRRATERAAEVKVIEPAIKALLVERVSAR